MDTKTLKKYEKKSVSDLINIAERHFNHFIRLRDSDNGVGFCISSGRPLRVPSKHAQCGHFYSAGSVPRLRFDEDNCNLQSLSDNYFKSGNQLEYRKNLIKKIGIERVERLDRISSDKSAHKWDRLYLIEIIETYREKVKEQKTCSIVKQLKRA